MSTFFSHRKDLLLIIVAALGYFVDIYDLILFGIVREASLRSIGVVGANIQSVGEQLISLQMYGMLLGGILWGIWGDKKGRLSVLFGSILMYSVANIANGMVHTVEMYGFWRFIAGIGLAGELGAGITLVSEALSKEKRGYGTMAITAFGLLGGVVGGFIAKQFDWRMAYYVGGGMGVMLLLLRLGVIESKMFTRISPNKTIRKGNFLSLFIRFYPGKGYRISPLFGKYVKSILIGIPIWFFAGVLIIFSPELAEALNIEKIKGPDGLQGISAGTSIVLFYGGLTLGDISSGLISQIWKSRKKVVYLFLLLSLVGMLLYLFLPGVSQTTFYSICFFIGFGSGYWAIFVTMASENFGTNIRSTVTTTTPNFVRGSLPLLIILFKFCRKGLPNWFPNVVGDSNSALVYSAFIVGLLTLVIAFFALRSLDETFNKDLNYVEK